MEFFSKKRLIYSICLFIGSFLFVSFGENGNFINGLQVSVFITLILNLGYAIAESEQLEKEIKENEEKINRIIKEHEKTIRKLKRIK